MNHPLKDRQGREGTRVAIGQTAEGRYLRVICVPGGAEEPALVVTAYPLGAKALHTLRRRRN